MSENKITLQQSITRIHPAISIVLGSVIIALLAQLKINLPFNPVPITGQTLGVLLVGGLLGARMGSYSTAIYLLEGAMGLPVFAGLTGGWIHLFSSTGGYLLGFVPAAYLMGHFVEKGWTSLTKLTFASTLATLVIFVSGLAWLSRFIDGQNLLMIGFLPFVPGAVVKITLASLGLKRLIK